MSAAGLARLQEGSCLRLEDGCLKGRTEEMDSFTVSLTPRNSGIAEWIASAVKGTLEKHADDEVDSYAHLEQKDLPSTNLCLQPKQGNCKEQSLMK